MRVVRGEDVESGEDAIDELLLLLGQRGVDGALVADGGGQPLRLGGRAEGAEPVGGIDRGVVAEVVGELVRGVPLVVGLLDREVGRDQVGTADAAVEQRAAGEDEGGRIAAADGVRHVMRGVARRVEHLHGQIPHVEGVAVVDRRRLEPELDTAGDDVRRAVLAGELEAAGDVVVVDVGLRDMRHGQPVLGEQVLHAVDIALGIDDQRRLPIVDDVAAIPQPGGIEDEDVRGSGAGHGSPLARNSLQAIPPGVSCARPGWPPPT